MKKYLKILAILLRNSYIRDSKIPGYVLSSLAFNIIEILTTIIFFNVIFSNTKNLAGWNFYQILFLYMVAKIIATFNSLLTKNGINSMSEDMIRRGNLDIYLTRPVDPMILISISKPKIYDLISLIFEICIAFYALSHVGIIYNLINVVLFILMFLLSLILYYFLRWFTIMPVFWFIRLWSLRDIMGKLNQFMRYPAGIFPNVLKYALFVFFPILATSYIPARTLFYQPKIEFIIYMFIVTILFGVFTKLLWQVGLKHYGSASS